MEVCKTMRNIWLLGQKYVFLQCLCEALSYLSSS